MKQISKKSTLDTLIKEEPKIETATSLKNNPSISNNIDFYTILNNDYLFVLKTLKDEFIDLICIDPPYNKINGMILAGQKEKVQWDDAINWATMFKEFDRIIKPGGTILVFGQNPTYAEMILANKKNYKFEYIWLKNNSAQGFHNDKMPLIFTENIACFVHKEDKNHKRTFNVKNVDEINKNEHFTRWYAKEITHFVNLPRRKIYEIIGNRKLEFFLYFNGKNFTVCSKELYNELINKFHIDKMPCFISYEELKAKWQTEKGRFYDASAYSISQRNYLQISKENKHYHPTQKPTELLRKLIETHSKENDLVLDCFMGSGSCGVACLQTNRRFFGVEKDEGFFEIAKERLETEVNKLTSKKEEKNGRK